MKTVMSYIFSGFIFISFSALSAGITRSAFTTEIKNKEPVSEFKHISVDVTRVYFFTELSGLNGHTITHRWEYNGKVMAEVHFQVSADRWRTWSSKNLLASWTGKWQVSVLDEGGNILEKNEFEYMVPQTEPPEEQTTLTQ
jgi:hypothetical protein